MTKSQNSSWVNVLLSAGLLSFIGGLIGLFYNSYHNRNLERQKFEYQLLRSTLEIDDMREQELHVQMLYQTGLLSEEFIDIDTINYYMSRRRGFQDGKATAGITGALRAYYSVYGRIPPSLEELGKSFKIKAPLDYYGGNVHYVASGPQQMDLRLPGRDGTLYTRDDKKYSLQQLLGN